MSPPLSSNKERGIVRPSCVRSRPSCRTTQDTLVDPRPKETITPKRTSLNPKVEYQVRPTTSRTVVHTRGIPFFPVSRRSCVSKENFKITNSTLKTRCTKGLYSVKDVDHVSISCLTLTKSRPLFRPTLLDETGVRQT